MKTAKDLKIPFTWEQRRPIFMDRFFYIPSHYDYKQETIPFFQKTQPIIIEYCSGNGQWIGDRALQNPEINWIAVDKRFERARKVWLKTYRENIPNLTVVCGEASTFTKFYAPQAEEIYVNFPDPWPKLRHAKNRLIQVEFLNDLLKILKPHGRATCVTDDATYATQMMEEFSKCPEWKKLFHLNQWPDYGKSFFNDLWEKRGRTFHYLSFEKI
ncbi:MAG: tRNA (guanosine(46)-N7)-methyltransferase TrmB [Chlamydiae bacterium CG10_big_fil_rev_8_21_14_0_10_42_34]|nr:MAG: tRNA (guanosine(46)-N7)-methyltransferase TrmB [Chlamydiae bacterium CG10_big_fil_rev_8_21_14_0_10_42_34]